MNSIDEKQILDILFTDNDKSSSNHLPTKNITFSEHNSICIIKFENQICIGAAEAIIDELELGLKDSEFKYSCYYILDLSRIRKIDYSGLLIIISLIKNFHNNNRLVDIVSKSAQLTYILKSIDVITKDKVEIREKMPI